MGTWEHCIGMQNCLASIIRVYIAVNGWPGEDVLGKSVLGITDGSNKGQMAFAALAVSGGTSCMQH